MDKNENVNQPGCSTYVREGVIGNDSETSNAHQDRVCYHYNGSGKEAFGGADKWPHLEINCSFPVNQIAARNALAEELMSYINEFLEIREL